MNAIFPRKKRQFGWFFWTVLRFRQVIVLQIGNIRKTGSILDLKMGYNENRLESVSIFIISLNKLFIVQIFTYVQRKKILYIRISIF